MHINTAVIKHIIPLLEKYEGKTATEIPFGTISEEIKRLTGKEVNYRRVLESAVSLAAADFHGRTFSFNIESTSSLRKEMEDSSQARRDRFRHLFNKNDFLAGRVGIKLESIRSDICFTINYILESETNRIYFAAIIGFYGNNINSWGERIGLTETVNRHATPSTHYMDQEGAKEYVYLLEKKVSFSVVK